jgi:hypothetical protein
MSRSDTVKAVPDVPFKPAGIGLEVRMRCGKCNQPMPNAGRKLQRHRGAKVWVGKCCQQVAGAR